MSLVLWILVYTGLRALVGLTAARFSSHILSKLVFFPGVLAAILVRAFTAGISQARVEELRPPWTAGPPVRLGASRTPLVRAFFFAILPPAAAAALPLLAALWMGFGPGFGIELPAVNPDAESLSLFGRSAREILDAVIVAAKEAHWRDPSLWAVIYLSVSFEVYLAPPTDEWGPLAVLLAALALALGAVRWLGLRPGFMSRAWFIEVFYGDQVWDCMARLVTHALLVLVLTSVFAGVAALAHLGARTEKPG